MIAWQRVTLKPIVNITQDKNIKEVKKMNKEDKILTEITKSCEVCSKRECYAEEDCVLFRIELILEEVKK